MGFLPSPDIDLSDFTPSELAELLMMLQVELAKCKARQAHIKALMKNVAKCQAGNP